MSSNYLQNLIDLDTYYVNANDVNYRALSASNISYRKTVVFGQNSITASGFYPLLNAGTGFNYNPSLINSPKIDADDTTVIGTTANTVYYINNKTGVTFLKTNTTPTTFWMPIVTTNIGGVGAVQQSGKSAVQIGYLPNEYSKFSVGASHCLAIKPNGTLWAWGDNQYGQLGLAITDTSARNSPTQVGGFSNWAQVTAGLYMSTAIKTDGTLWTWGVNSSAFNSGGLGLGDLSHRYTPVQVGTESNWYQVACGYGSTLVIKTDGTLWAWGRNYGCVLGIGNPTTSAIVSTPVQVGTLSNWYQVSAGSGSSDSYALAIKTDGTLWAWGSGKTALGINSVAVQSIPIQVGTLSNWSQVAAGGYSGGSGGGTSVAIKTDGTLWSWGDNTYGQLGLNTTATARSSPVQVGNLSNWVSASVNAIFATGTNLYAVRSDGTLWGAGVGDCNLLLTNDVTRRSSLVQIGSSNNWQSVISSKFSSPGGTCTLVVDKNNTPYIIDLTNKTTQSGTGDSQNNPFKAIAGY